MTPVLSGPTTCLVMLTLAIAGSAGAAVPFWGAKTSSTNRTLNWMNRQLKVRRV